MPSGGPGVADLSEIPSDAALQRGARRIVAVYAVTSASWILGSDWLLGQLVHDPAWWTRLAVAKGWLFVALSAMLIYLLVRSRSPWSRLRGARSGTHVLGGLALMRAIADGSTDAIFAKDLAGRYILCNREAARVMGMSVDAVLGNDDTRLFPPPEAAAIMDNDRRVIEDRRVQTYEEVLSTSDGVVTYLATKGPLRDQAGRIIGMFGISRDITVRKRAERALQDAHELVQAVEDSVLDHMAVLDADGVIVAVNAAWTRFATANAEDVRFALRSGIGANYLDITKMADGPGSEGAVEAHAGIASVLRRECEQFQLEYACPSPTEARWFQMTVMPLRTARGGAVVVHADITARRLAEDQLRKLSLAVEQNPLGIVIADTDGRIEYANDAFARLAGCAANDAVGRRYEEVHPSVAAATECSAEAAIDGAWNGTRDHTRPDGSQCRILLRTAPIRQADGRTTHRLAILEDVTERERVQAELERHRGQLARLVDERTAQLQSLNRELVERERFVRTIADNQPCLLVYWDADTRCRFANRAYQDWFGMSEEQIIGKRYDELMPASNVGDNRLHIEAAMRGEPQRFQRLIRNCRDDARHSMISYIPDIVDGTQRGFLALALDVDEMKRNELELQRVNAELVLSRDSAEAANRAKSAFVANMSHEIRTPMNAIIGLAYLLRRHTSEPVALDRLSKLSDAGGHLLQLIDDILDLSKIEAGRLELECTDFSFAEVLTRCKAFVAQRAEDKGLRLEIVSHGVPDSLRGDPTRLSQALLNLMSNAVKFTDTGSVIVHAEPVCIEPAGVTVRLAVRDTGIGIAADKMDALFQAFVQADTSTTRRFGGTGLGLAITKRLAEMMGGEIGLTSQPGQGSEFWLTARLALGSSAVPSVALDETELEEQLRRHAAGLRVLVVEDNPVNQEIAGALLASVGIEAVMASNGLEALGRVMQTHVDAILMDVQMPGMDGLQTTRHLRALPSLSHVPIIAFTASAFGTDSIECLQAGMNDHIAKPIVPAQLHAALLRWLPANATASSASTACATPQREHDDELDRLDALLQAGDFGADAAYRRIRPGMQARFGVAASEFETALAAYDHERARVLLKRLRHIDEQPAKEVPGDPAQFSSENQKGQLLSKLTP